MGSGRLVHQLGGSILSIRGLSMRGISILGLPGLGACAWQAVQAIQATTRRVDRNRMMFSKARVWREYLFGVGFVGKQERRGLCGAAAVLSCHGSSGEDHIARRGLKAEAAAELELTFGVGTGSVDCAKVAEGVCVAG